MSHIHRLCLYRMEEYVKHMQYLRNSSYCTWWTCWTLITLKKEIRKIRMSGLSLVEEFYCLEQLTCLIWLTRLPTDVHEKGDIKKYVHVFVRMYVCTQICALDERMYDLRTWWT